MSTIAGTHKCTNCQNDINWDYCIPRLMSGYNYSVGTQSSNRYHAERVNDYSSEVIKLSVRCNKCFHTDEFEYIPDNTEG